MQPRARQPRGMAALCLALSSAACLLLLTRGEGAAPRRAPHAAGANTDTGALLALWREESAACRRAVGGTLSIGVLEVAGAGAGSCFAVLAKAKGPLWQSPPGEEDARRGEGYAKEGSGGDAEAVEVMALDGLGAPRAPGFSPLLACSEDMAAFAPHGFHVQIVCRGGCVAEPSELLWRPCEGGFDKCGADELGPVWISRRDMATADEEDTTDDDGSKGGGAQSESRAGEPYTAADSLRVRGAAGGTDEEYSTAQWRGSRSDYLARLTPREAGLAALVTMQACALLALSL